MKKLTVDMGCYYTADNDGTLVKTVCRARSATAEGKDIIVFSFIGQGGVASETMYIPEDEFISRYIS